MNITNIAKQLLLNQTCMTCNYHDWYYPVGDNNKKIHMCDNQVKISGTNKDYIDLDKRGTCED